MLLCRKVTRLGFDVRYSPKHVFTVSTLSVDQAPGTTKGGKVLESSSITLEFALSDVIFFPVFLCLSIGSKRSG